MLTTWFQKKAAPVRVEVKRQSIRLYPPLPAMQESSNIIPMCGTSAEKEAGETYARPSQWEQSWQGAVAS